MGPGRPDNLFLSHSLLLERCEIVINKTDATISILPERSTWKSRGRDVCQEIHIIQCELVAKQAVDSGAKILYFISV